MEQFPSDRPLLQRVLDTGRGYYTWTPYALYRDNELLGSASLMPMQVQLDGRNCEVAGIASVATVSRYRRLGIARRLLEHCLGITDRWGVPCVLFSSLPRVYEGVGFREVPQEYVGVRAEQLRFPAAAFTCKRFERLDGQTQALLARIYSQRCPAYTGKIDRNSDYWELYQLLFDPAPRAMILLCQRQGTAVGYARCEQEADRLLVCELCADPRETGVLEAIFSHIAAEARQAGSDWVTLAVPRDHFARQYLEHRGIAPRPEPPGAVRETFMVRPCPGEPLGPLGALQWSLADKF
jgi:predicted acetyltransferase